MHGPPVAARAEARPESLASGRLWQRCRWLGQPAFEMSATNRLKQSHFKFCGTESVLAQVVSSCHHFFLLKRSAVQRLELTGIKNVERVLDYIGREVLERRPTSL